MALQLTLTGCNPEDASEACLEGGRPSSGAGLAALLVEATGLGTWFLGPMPLDRVERLPEHGHLLLSTTALPLPRSDLLPATSDSRSLYLVVVEGPDPGPRLPLLRGEHTIGRADADLCVADPGLSRIHARILVDGLGVRVIDLESGNGITVAGHRVPDAILVEGSGFGAGESTFTVMGAGSDPEPADRSWPQEPLPVEVPPPSGRILPQALGALLPMLVGIGLFVVTGSWYFLAFCFIGLATGGVSALSSLRERRRHRRSLEAAVTKDECRRRSLALPPGEATQYFRAAPACLTGPDAAVICVGRGNAPANVPTGALVRGAPFPQVRDVPCFLPRGPGSLGILDGPEPSVHALVRSMLLRLAPELCGGACTVVLTGDASFLPVEVRRLPGVSVLDRLPGSHGFPPRALVLVLGPDAAACSDARVLSSEPSGPGFVLVCPRGWPQSADWSVDAGSGRVVHGQLTSIIRPDRLGAEVLGTLLGSVLPAPGFGPLPGAVPRPCPRGADATHRLACRIGPDDPDPVELDLVADGPHLLIAGTTGSGKSELLRSLVLGLCLEYPATELALMLIDFKGGSALGPLGTLPQVQSLATDLDGDGASRALESLGAELRRRETLLAAAGAGDYAEYRTIAEPDTPPLPRLVVVIDEFRVLGAELPDATDRVIRLATIGRSLGMHLVLATQRPQGAVPAELRANINTVLCLRLQSEFESSELLGTPDAAGLDPTAPGSALMRRGTGNVLRFRVAGRTEPETPPRLLVYGARLGRPRVATGPMPVSRHPMGELVETVARRFAPSEIPENPFPRPLPRSLVYLPRRILGTIPTTGIGLGLLDLVAEQRSTCWWWNPRTMGRLAVIGHPASGVGPLLGHLLAGLPGIGARALVLDGAGSLADWSSAPQVAGYVGAAEPERVADVIGLLADAESDPALVLLVTGMASWAGVMDAQAFSELDGFLAARARRSHGPGAALVLAGDRDAGVAKAYALCEHRLFLPLGSGPETTIGWPRLRKVAKIPGRGVWVGPETPAMGHAVQLLTVGATPPEPPQLRPMDHRQRPYCLPLPSRITLAELPEQTSAASHGTLRYLVGVTGPDNRRWSWEPGKVGLVLGREGAGKSTLIALLAANLGSAARLFRMDDATIPDACSAADELGDGVCFVLIDDADRDPSRAARLLERAASRSLPVVVAARPAASLCYALPVGSVLRSGESVLVLGPIGRSEADQLGFRMPDLPRGVPGRGAVLDAGQVRRIQCLLPEDPD